MASDHGGGGSVLMAFMIGAVVGAGLALLFAPATGERTREYLGRRAREGRERAEEAVRRGREVLGRERENLRSAFDRARPQSPVAAAGPAEDA
jgi:gas vesicle protein